MQVEQQLRKKAIAEFIGTFCMMFAGCGSVMVHERFPNLVAASSAPQVFGLSVATMIYAVGHISGAHFNPAVSLAFALTKHFPPRALLAYWLAQFTAAFAAISLLVFILPSGAEFAANLAN